MESRASFFTVQDALESDAPKSLVLKDELAFHLDPRIAAVKSIHSLCLITSGWSIIPPNGIVPGNIFIYEWNDRIFTIRGLEDLRLINIHVSAVPRDIMKLSKLRYLQISLSPNAICEAIVEVLKEISTLETLNITGSYLTTDQYHSIKRTLPGVTVISVEHQIGSE